MFEIMVVSGNGQRHTIPVGDDWTPAYRTAIALTYEASGFDVTTGYGRL